MNDNSFSENYVFGKFNSFCEKLNKILRVINSIDENSELENLKMDGSEEIVDNFRMMINNIKKKNYDCLDLKKQDVKIYFASE